MRVILVWLVRLALIFLFLELSTALCPFCSKDQLRKLKIIPNLANDVNSTNLKVVYGGKTIKCGGTVNILQASNPPTLYFNVPRRCKYATIMMIEPFALVPSPYLDWLVVNVPPDNLRKGFSNPVSDNRKDNGFTAAEFNTPKDPDGGSGLRNSTVVFFVYCQCSKTLKRKYTSLYKGPFDVKGYAEKNNLGDPVAGFFHLFSLTGLTLPTLVKSPL